MPKELPEPFKKGDNYKGKNIISFSSSGRYYTLGTGDIKPIVITGPVEELITKLNQLDEEKKYPPNEKEYLKILPASLITVSRLTQVQYPNIFIHMVRNQYANGNAVSKLVISGRVSYFYNVGTKRFCYYPANDSLIYQRQPETDEEFKDLTGYERSEWPFRQMPEISRTYRMNHLHKYTKDKVDIEGLKKYKEETINKGKKIEPELIPAFETIIQWLENSMAKVDALESNPGKVTKKTTHNPKKDTKKDFKKDQRKGNRRYHKKKPYSSKKET